MSSRRALDLPTVGLGVSSQGKIVICWLLFSVHVVAPCKAFYRVLNDVYGTSSSADVAAFAIFCASLVSKSNLFFIVMKRWTYGSSEVVSMCCQVKFLKASNR